MTRRVTRNSTGSLVALTVALVLTACGGSSTPPRPAGAGGLSGDVVVFAAASLTTAFEQVREDFEAGHPGVQVVLNVGGSAALAQQILSGAPADVFAAANTATMQTVVDAGEATGAQVFARNRLEIAVPPDNPARVAGLSDLSRPALTIALCAPEVPCGAAATEVFTAAGLVPAPDTLEQDVRAVLSKVRLGEVDAGLVYRTDVLSAAGEVTGIAFPEAEQAVQDYPLVALATAPNAAAAEAFVAYVLSREGQAVLAAAGFDTG